MKTLKSVAVLFAVASVWSATVLAAPTMDVIDIAPGIEDSGWRLISSLAINNSGQIVGIVQTAEGQRGFIWENGVMTTMGCIARSFDSPLIPIPFPGTGYVPWSSALDINDQGLAVGMSGPYDDAFLWQNGAMWLMPSLNPNVFTIGGSCTGPSGINNAGQIVGNYYDYSDSSPYRDRRGYLWDNGIYRDLGRSDLWPSAVNDSGVVVGTISPGSGAFLWENGVFTDIGSSLWSVTDVNNLRQVVGSNWGEACLWDGGSIILLSSLGGQFSSASAINDIGQVVGSSFVSSLGSHAFIWQDGVMTDLNSLIPADSGWVLEYATDINESGEIVGHGSYKGELRQFLCAMVSHISIDVRPGDSSNTINLKSKGKLPVAVLASSDCPIDSINVSTVSFAGAKAARYARQDVDGDGDEDLLLHFSTPELDLNATIEASLIGRFSGGGWFVGSQMVKVVSK